MGGVALIIFGIIVLLYIRISFITFFGGIYLENRTYIYGDFVYTFRYC